MNCLIQNDYQARNKAAIDDALRALDSAATTDPTPAIFPPVEPGEPIRGNETGFLCLATACLRAAQGLDQSFSEEGWLIGTAAPKEISGLEFDRMAHMDIPKPRTRGETVRASVYLVLLSLALVIPYFIGMLTSFQWLESRIVAHR
jgi:hypothetical protein